MYRYILLLLVITGSLPCWGQTSTDTTHQVDGYFYQFQAVSKTELTQVAEGVVAYYAADQLLHQQSTPLSSTDAVTITLADPQEVFAKNQADGASNIRIYRGAGLIQSMSLEEYLQYNRELIHREPEAVQTAYRLQQESQAAFVRQLKLAGQQLITQQGLQGAELDTTGATRALDSCTLQCRGELRACQRECAFNEGGYFCELDCQSDYQLCLSSCPGADADNDGITNTADNCPVTYNPDQADCDNDGIGNACESPGELCPLGDEDNDGVPNNSDNCPLHSNSNQADCDADGIGDVCDTRNGSHQATNNVEVCEVSEYRNSFSNIADLSVIVGQEYADTSSCAAPSYYLTYTADTATCSTNDPNRSVERCCAEELGLTIFNHGGNIQTWCYATIRNVNFCR